MTRRGSHALRFRDQAELDALPRSRDAYVDAPLEAVVQGHVLEALRLHPRVAWVARFNTAAGRLQYRDGSASRFLRFGFPGLSDILGQMRTGLLLAVECKRAGCYPTDEQQAFLDAVKQAGGVAFVARSAVDVFHEIPV